MPMYIGRFAPSPSGPLHFGSLVCALASYLDAKFHRGQWLLRIEDIDPPRESPVATRQIIQSLQEHALLWDGDISYQSKRSALYRRTLDDFLEKGLAYRCNCTRKRLQALNYLYDGHCRQHTPAPKTSCALRLDIAKALQVTAIEAKQVLSDRFQPSVEVDFLNSPDFVIHRRDGLFAYQLAVSCDDAAQGITHVVRGSDLLDSSPAQILLLQLLGAEIPRYGHIPVITDDKGNKLSKQNFAEALRSECAASNLVAACLALGLDHAPDSAQTSPERVLEWAKEHWSPTLIPRCMSQKQSGLLYNAASIR